MRKIYITIFLLLISSNFVFAQPYATAPTAQADSIAVTLTQGTVKALMDKAKIPGLAIAIAKDSQIIYSEGFGLADIENGQSVFPKSKFRIGSISKPLTATLLMKMYQERQIDLDSPIKKYWSSVPENYANITPRQLAGHLGGVRHYREGEYFKTTQYNSVKESLEIFINDTLVHKPGTKYHYSTYGYVLLSAILEKAGDASFLELMRNKLLAPLSMNATVAEYSDSIIYHRAEFYGENEQGELVNAPSENYSYKWAGGGYMSNVEDLANFGSKLMDDDFISQENVTQMYTSQKDTAGQKIGYGIGWEIGEDWKQRFIVKHGGSSSGARSFIMLYPKQNLTIAILSNKGRAPIFEGEASVIADYFLDDQDTITVKQNIEGVYRYQRIVNDRKQEGTLTLVKKGNIYDGIITNFYSTVAPIVNVQTHNGQVIISAATSSGIANFWLSFDNKGFTGMTGWDSPAQKVTGMKLN